MARKTPGVPPDQNPHSLPGSPNLRGPWRHVALEPRVSELTIWITLGGPNLSLRYQGRGMFISDVGPNNLRIVYDAIVWRLPRTLSGNHRLAPSTTMTMNVDRQ